MGKAVVALALAVLAGCGGGGGARDASATQVAHAGQPAPDWTEPTTPTGTLTLSSLRGHPVYLNLFATWCGPCNEEAPSIEALQKEFGPAGLQIVGIDILEDAAKAQGFKDEYHLTYPVAVDDGKVRDQYKINGLPVHAFIDRNGVVKNIVIGQMSASEIRSSVVQIMQR